MSSQEIQSYPTGALFKRPWRSRVVKSFRSLTEAGIWTHVEKWEVEAKNLNRLVQ